jgi:peptide deformylase
MILPIVAYGDIMLRTICKNIDETYPNLIPLVANMVQTQIASNGIGLAAPQVDLPIRLFVVGYPNHPQVPLKVFINPEIVSYSTETCSMPEGCLSIPGLNADVIRPESVTVRYNNPKFETIEETFDGIYARVVQHEYDHIEGKLFIDYLSDEKKQEINNQLEKIIRKEVQTKYPLK